MLRGIEKYALPMPLAKVSSALYEDSDQREELIAMLQNWTYDGYAITDENAVELEFPTASANFDIETFQSYLNSSERQIFRLVLGQDSTSSADNSNRSTAQVHNLVRQDILASDALAVENTVNTQIIKPLALALWGENVENIPLFRFNLKGTGEQQAIATLVSTLKDTGYEVSANELSAKLGFEVTKIESTNTETQDV
jgi:phage gp29-like protein